MSERRTVGWLLLFLLALIAMSLPALGRPPALLLQAAASAPAHSVTLTWTPSADSDGGTVGSNNVYRAPGACSAAGTMAQIATAVAAPTYKDGTVAVGESYCYEVTFVINGTESAPTNEVSVTVKPFPDTGLAGASD